MNNAFIQRIKGVGLMTPVDCLLALAFVFSLLLLFYVNG